MLGIFGAGRNGSTLLMRLLDGSPDLWVFPIELDILGLLEERASLAPNEWALRFDAWAGRELTELRESYVARLAEPLDAAEPEFSSDVRASGAQNLVAFLNSVERSYSPGGEREHAFKTIEVTGIDRWTGLFPTMRLLHIVRDPVANYASLKRTDMLVKGKPFWFQEGDTLRAFVELRWLPHVRYALEASERDPARHRLVRYEDLCADPRDVLGGICDWLGVGLPPDPELQTVLGGRRLREQPTATSGGDSAPERVVVRDERHADVVTARERSWLAYRLGAEAQRLGYELGPRPSRLSLAGRWLLPDRWELMNAPSKPRLTKALLARRAYLAERLLRGAA